MDALDRRKREREMAQRYRNGNISNDNQAEWVNLLFRLVCP
jgi:hypothetical protein